MPFHAPRLAFDGNECLKMRRACLIFYSTGMKCLPAHKIPASNGRLLHDSHAEILAIRSFNCFLLHECAKLASSPTAASAYITRLSDNAETRPFTLNPSLKLHLYASEAPCGDASMELTMRMQEDSTPWPVTSAATGDGLSTLKGRGYFSELGVVRRKPARGDSPESLSKSCSDKLALRQCMSLLSSMTALLVEPKGAYLTSVVVPESQYTENSFERSFGATGRMKDVAGLACETGYAFKSFKIRTTKIEFRYSRSSVGSQISNVKGSNICAVWNPYVQETVINGALQGWKQDHPRCASSLARTRMSKVTLDILKHMNPERYNDALAARTYRDLKNTVILAGRRRIKSEVLTMALKGWVPNANDSFELEEI